MPKMIVSVGICLYNEEKNISNMLVSLLSQKLKKTEINEIIIIVSGSTDKTYKIVKSFQKKNKKIKIFHQKERRGKASAVNFFIQKAKNNILILLGGDIILSEDVIENLVKKFTNPHIGMVGAHPVPINHKEKGFFNFAGYMLWELHHRLAQIYPKMGEVVAFRKIFKRIPMSSSVDEANIEPLIKGQGYAIAYVPEAVVYNKTPANLDDFINQRKRIFAGHLAVKSEQGYQVATMQNLPIVIATYSFIKEQKKIQYIFYAILVIGIEIYSRIQGMIAYKIYKKNHTVWDQITSTKQLFEE